MKTFLDAGGFSTALVGRAALFLAVKDEQLQLVQLLIESGAAVNTGDVTGILPFT
jgi:hypothetical protein